jgi:hypothetical protein
LAQVSSNSKFQEEIILNSIEFKPRNFSEFSCKMPSKSEEVFMEKVLYLFKIFKTVFCFKFLELRNVPFESVKVWKNLNVFKPFEFENGLNCLDPSLPGSPLQAPPHGTTPIPPNPLLHTAPPLKRHRPPPGQKFSPAPPFSSQGARLAHPPLPLASHPLY